MIHDMDRSGYIGGSDCRFVMANNRNTKTWKEWFDVKCGLMQANMADNIYTRAGTLWEHPILKALDEDIILDGQIIYERYKIRINYDGWRDGIIYECKTHKADKPFEISTNYWQQAQAEMFVYKTMYKQWFLPEFKKLYIVSYALGMDEYYREEDEIVVDPKRIVLHEVKYDKAWIMGEYLPRVKEIVRAMKRGKFPM